MGLEKDVSRRAANRRGGASVSTRRYFAAAVAWLAVTAAVADVIVMKTGEQITGEVTRFEHGEHSLASSHFVVDVDGKEQKIPLFKIESVTFGPAASRALPAVSVPPTRTERKAPESGDYWLSSTGKRHNSSCRYYKSAKGRPCGAKDGVACKVCGG